MKVLVTGGAGFVGSHLVDALVEQGHTVRIFDNLTPQVHGAEQKEPDYLNRDAEFLRGDILDADAMDNALNGIEVVVHLAAAVGVSQSMYEIKKYTENNTLGGAVLLQQIISGKHDVEKVVVASSMSIYGEGQYECSDCGTVAPKLRPLEQLRTRNWEMTCPSCNAIVQPVPTNEDKPLNPTSVYAITKRDHEEMFLSVCFSFDIPCVSLRYFNIYGSRQALSNPYTGVAAIFSSRILNGHAPVIFEDGLQKRDFTHVSDIVNATILAMEKPNADYQALNVGTGRPLSVLDVANLLISKLNPDLTHEIANQFRGGDIRHCYGDISRIHSLLGYEPGVRFEDGIAVLTEWVREQTAIDSFEKAHSELKEKGLTI
jgi:dTDP-L-rhamnose 4-epimerase